MLKKQLKIRVRKSVGDCYRADGPVRTECVEYSWGVLESVGTVQLDDWQFHSSAITKAELWRRAQRDHFVTVSDNTLQ